MYKTKEQVHNRGKKAVGKTVIELANNMPTKKISKKSAYGDAWESWFGVEKNNVAGPDLPEAKVELKATGIKTLRNGKHSAKERLVLNIIDYEKEFDKTFDTSSFWNKNQYTEIGFYDTESSTFWEDKKFVESVLFTFPEKDLLIIKHDWEIIHEYIKTNRAHEISESLTYYLAACTKGSSSKDLRPQKDKDAPKAKQRAYSLKNRYMTALLRDYVFGDKKDKAIRIATFAPGEVHEKRTDFYSDELIKDLRLLEINSIEEIVQSKLFPYIGKTQDELIELFNIDVVKNEKGNYPNQLNSMLIQHMLGLKVPVENTEEFYKANISVKTIRVSENNRIRENMSFPAFDFKKVAAENWEESKTFELFDSSRFFFVVFKENDRGDFVFHGTKFWSMPEKDIDGPVREVWEDTKFKLNGNLVLEYKEDKKVYNNLIGKGENLILSIRPHSSKRSYIDGDTNGAELPFPAKWINKPSEFSDNWMTKQCFWLNNNYIQEQIKDLL
jgi:DNA mismatch repair protein MutH